MRYIMPRITKRKSHYPVKMGECRFQSPTLERHWLRRSKPSYLTSILEVKTRCIDKALAWDCFSPKVFSFSRCPDFVSCQRRRECFHRKFPAFLRQSLFALRSF